MTRRAAREPREARLGERGAAVGLRDDWTRTGSGSGRSWRTSTSASSRSVPSTGEGRGEARLEGLNDAALRMLRRRRGPARNADDRASSPRSGRPLSSSFLVGAFRGDRPARGDALARGARGARAARPRGARHERPRRRRREDGLGRDARGHDGPRAGRARRGLGGGGAPDGARDQEPAHAGPARRRADPAEGARLDGVRPGAREGRRGGGRHDRPGGEDARRARRRLPPLRAAARDAASATATSAPSSRRS